MAQFTQNNSSKEVHFNGPVIVRANSNSGKLLKNHVCIVCSESHAKGPKESVNDLQDHLSFG